MINLISGEFYKARRSRSAYVCSIIMIAFALFIYCMFLMSDKITQGEIENGTAGVYVGMDSEMEAQDGEMEVQESGQVSFVESTSILEFVAETLKSVGAIVTAIFAAIFVIGEYTNGAIKNVTGKGYARWKVFLAKYAVTVAMAMLMLIILMTASFLFGILFKGTGELDAAFAHNFFCLMGIQLLLHAAFIGIVVTIDEICRSLGVGISLSIVVFTFSGMLTAAIDLVCKLLFKGAKMHPSRYWIVNLIMDCPYKDIGRSPATRAALIAIAWILVSAAIGTFHFVKTDVK